MSAKETTDSLCAYNKCIFRFNKIKADPVPKQVIEHWFRARIARRVITAITIQIRVLIEIIVAITRIIKRGDKPQVVSIVRIMI